MNKEIMITQQDLIDWLDRPPSNNDIDLINFIVCRLDNFYKLKEENERLKNQLDFIGEQNHIIDKLEKENERLKLVRDTKCASEILCECLNNVYKSRNEKAIEFVKEHQRKDEFLNLNEWQTKDLLNILGLGDKDE